ncbi:hypothetical protein GGI25_004369 [Coemansia spiralis]|uniref:Carbohydrate-binding module family 96 domain-containing protein n=2 Tax=Coemansia TaxID=4863 RepID=A0A9W8G481_9FUNG|nr:hypothetical protein BX070DRAFT_234357 [Coemansia spiralis]KAJ1995322.1 hypothetical protein EDC05_000873 [Coemansia umbellata]KAJ2674349.1 hypothetical protein GGI25_004369 [Coemansia spiralis]
MRLFQATSLLAVFGQLFAYYCAAEQYDSTATKDSSILRANAKCPNCPESNCSKCTFGHENNLVVNIGGTIYETAIVGFHMPVAGSQVSSCVVQMPTFLVPIQSDLNVTIFSAAPLDWNEDTVDGENAPPFYKRIANVYVPASTNLGPVDITQACQDAVNGEFSIYFTTDQGYYQFLSKDSGHPASLRITTK